MTESRAEASRPRKTKTPYVTQQDLAEAANVSQSVVSAVLRNDSSKVRFSEHIRKRILEIAEEKHYKFNPGAGIIRSGRTHNIGLLLSHPHTFPYVSSHVFNGFSRRAAELGYYLSLIFDPTSSEDEKYQLPRSFREMHVDGYLVFHTGMLTPELEARLAQDDSHAVIYVNDMRGKNAIRPLEEDGVRLAVDHLFAAGYKRLAFFGPEMSPGSSHYSGPLGRSTFEQTCVARNREPLFLSLPRDSAPANFEILLDRLLAECGGAGAIDGFVCSNDSIAVRLCGYALRRGIPVPEQWGIVGCNNELIAALSPIPLTTVHIDWEAMAVEAVDRLVEMIEKPKRQFKSVTHPVTLVQRESTRSTPGARSPGRQTR